MDILVKLLPGIIIAVLTAWLTVRFSLKRFYAEKWWERKYNKYESLLNSLYDVRDYAIEYERDEMDQNYEVSKEKELEMVKKSRNAIEALNKELVIGEFLLSNNAIIHLKKLRESLDSADSECSWGHHLLLIRKAIEGAIPSIIDCAKIELKSQNL